MKKILVVEDEHEIAELVNDYLAQNNFKSLLIDNGLDVISAVKEHSPDLILLDVMLPGKDGMTLCKEIRTFSNTPIIMLTARVEEIDRLLGLELGADDYICKPFSPREVIARVKAVLRRFNNEPVVDPYNISLLAESNKLSLGNHQIELTVVEYKLFKQMYNAPGRIFSRNHLMDEIYSDHRIVNDRTIDSHIKKLRKKIHSVLPDVELIHSIYGAGYKYDPHH